MACPSWIPGSWICSPSVANGLGKSPSRDSESSSSFKTKEATKQRGTVAHGQLAELVTKGELQPVEKLLRELQGQMGAEKLASEIQSREYGERMAPSVLFCAATRGYSEIVKVLLEFKGDATAIDDAGNTPMHYASDLGRARCVKILLDAGADPNSKNNFGHSAKDNAQAQSWDDKKIAKGKTCIRKLFDGEAMQLGEMPTDENKRPRATTKIPDGVKNELFREDFCIAELASGRRTQYDGRLGMERLSVNEGRGKDEPSQPKTDTKVQTIVADTVEISDQVESLAMTVKKGDIQAIENRLAEIRKRGGDKAVCEELCDHEGSTDMRIAQSPLHVAAANDDVQVLKLLLATKADVNVSNDSGNTPLHLAADLGRYDNVHELLAAGANPRLRNNFGHTAEHNAEGHSWESNAAKEQKTKIRQTIIRHT